MGNLASYRRVIVSVILALSALKAGAAEELAVQAYDQSGALSGVEISINGEVAGVTARDGSALLDLEPGGQVVALQFGDTEKVLRFSVGAGQLTDLVVTLGESGFEHYLDVYSPVSSVAEKRDVARGTLVIQVTKGSRGAPNQIVMVSGAGAVSTNSQGRAEIELARGPVTVSLGDSEKTLRVLGGVTRSVRFELPSDESAVDIALPQIEEVVVMGVFNPAGMEVSERDTTSIVDTMDNELLVRFSDADVAAAVVRVPGISVQDDKFIFIRGLGGRYITSTLNGSTLPSTDPSKRTVPLDLFPSSFVNQLDIKKTFLSFMPGESTGGNLVINTKTFPDEPGGSVSLGFGGVAGLIGSDVAVDPVDGNFDFIGWDAKERSEPASINIIAQALNLGRVEDTKNGTSFELNDSIEGELRRVGAVLLAEDFDLDLSTAAPDIDVGADYGDLFYFGEHEVGYFAAVNFSNSWTHRDNGVRNSYTPTGEILDNFVYQSVKNEIEASGLLAIGWNFGDTTLESNTLVSRVTESSVERSIGEEGDERQAVYRQSIEWVERQFISQQIVGSHSLNDSGSFFLDWQFTGSQARRDAPARRESEFRASQSQTSAESLKAGFDFDQLNDNQSVALNGFFVEPGVVFKRYDELTDENLDASFDFTWDLFDDGDAFSTLKFGFGQIMRERESESKTYGFNINQARDDLLNTDNLLISEVIFAGVDPETDTISDNPNDGFTFVDKTLASDSYDAELDYSSAYISLDHTFNSSWQVLLGARYEVYEQTTETFSLQGTQDAVESRIDESSVLPGLGVNWFINDSHQLRFAVSETVARPDFKEAANATFYDTEFNFRVRGNPFLEISSILNADLRWEWYFDEQDSLSVALFYKDFDKPIERVVQPASGTAGNSRTFTNSDSAELYGFEIEGRKEFMLGDDYDDSIFVSFNTAVIESEVTFGGQTGRPLQGQPEYTANLVVGYDNFISGQQLTLLLNQSGESIADVGVSGAPDVIFEPRLDLNIVYRWDFSERGVLKAKLANLLNADYEYTQGGGVFQRYEKGVSVSVGVDWKF